MSIVAVPTLIAPQRMSRRTGQAPGGRCPALPTRHAGPVHRTSDEAGYGLAWLARRAGPQTVCESAERLVVARSARGTQDAEPL